MRKVLLNPVNLNWPENVTEFCSTSVFFHCMFVDIDFLLKSLLLKIDIRDVFLFFCLCNVCWFLSSLFKDFYLDFCLWPCPNAILMWVCISCQFVLMCVFYVAGPPRLANKFHIAQECVVTKGPRVMYELDVNPQVFLFYCLFIFLYWIIIIMLRC